jgi:ferric-chelate reductase
MYRPNYQGRGPKEQRDFSALSTCCPRNKAATDRLRFRWWHAIFVFSAISLIVCLLQVFLPPPFGLMQPSEQIAQQPFSGGCADGIEYCICPRETICAEDLVSMILLALARCSVFFDYPLYMMLFLTKAHNINNALRRTIVREWVEFSGFHDAHSIFGIVVGIETMFHSFFHLLRWVLHADIHLLWESRTGISGLVAAVVTPLIVWPMALPLLKRRIKFEVRKCLHYLSWAWALALVFHAPYRIYWLLGIPALVYLVDWLVGLFPRNHLIETIKFERNGALGVVLSFQNPPGFDCAQASYIYLLLPWLSKYQWHAFSVFPNSTEKDSSTVYIKKAGDWTEALYSAIRLPVHKPGYCIGPFRSPFSDGAVEASNCIAGR